jgi:hypothetical protein
MLAFHSKALKKVNEKLHQLASSKICEHPPKEYGEVFSKLLILNVTTTAHLPTLFILSPVTSFNSPTITMCHIPRCIKNPIGHCDCSQDLMQAANTRSLLTESNDVG